MNNIFISVYLVSDTAKYLEIKRGKELHHKEMESLCQRAVFDTLRLLKACVQDTAHQNQELL